MNEEQLQHWRELELLVTEIQRQLAPDAEVSHDVKLPGRDSERMRQIDVLVRKKIGQYEMLIIIDCKDLKNPVDVKGVEEFHGLMTDVGAHRGVIVSPRGFSQSAKKRARRYGVDLYSPVDTNPHKWQVKATAPVVCRFRDAKMQISLRVSAPKPFALPGDFYESSMAFDKDRRELGTPIRTAIERWNNGEFPNEPGEHKEVPIYREQPVLVDNGYGELIEVQLDLDLHVRERVYFGNVAIEKLRGFKDEQTGAVITNAFTFGLVSPEEVQNRWQRLEPGKELPGPALLHIVGLALWGRDAIRAG